MPIPFVGEEFTFFNPDGSEIKVRGWGNQFSAVFETMDGYTVTKDPKSGFFQYAKLSEDKNELVPTGSRIDQVEGETVSIAKHIRVRRESARTQALMAQSSMGAQLRWEQRWQERRATRLARGVGPEAAGALAGTVGSYVGLCVLIQFPDVSGTITTQQVGDYCNQTGYSAFGNNGSVRDYFHDVSDGKLDYTNVVTAYYSAKNSRAYYTDPKIGYGKRARELIIEALDHLKSQGFNFSQLTTDNQGYVRALNVFYAGPSVNNWAEGLWPHSSGLGKAYDAGSNIKLSDYQITNMGSQLTLGTFCHENGHMICDYPDLYDYGYESNGVGNYCLMCFGGSSKNPTQVCAYLKNEAGWASKQRSVSPGMTYDVAAGTNDFLLYSKDQNEYFIIENRQKSKRDATLPDAGLAIWHVDEKGSNNNEQMTPAKHYKCSLEQADGRFDMEKQSNAGDSDDLFGAPSATAFGAATSPSSHWWDGSDSGFEITDISAPGPTMTVSTKSAWQNNQVVVQTHAKNGAKQTWAYIDGFGWLLVSGKTTDGNQNLFLLLSEARANGRKVDLLIENGKITQATLR